MEKIMEADEIPVELDNYPPYWITNINKKQLQNIDKKDHMLSHKWVTNHKLSHKWELHNNRHYTKKSVNTC